MRTPGVVGGQIRRLDDDNGDEEGRLHSAGSTLDDYYNECLTKQRQMNASIDRDDAAMAKIIDKDHQKNICRSSRRRLMDILRNLRTSALRSGRKVHLVGHSFGGGAGDHPRPGRRDELRPRCRPDGEAASMDVRRPRGGQLPLLRIGGISLSPDARFLCRSWTSSSVRDVTISTKNCGTDDAGRRDPRQRTVVPALQRDGGGVA